jgi:hypothetical protein
MKRFLATTALLCGLWSTAATVKRGAASDEHAEHEAMLGIPEFTS